MTIYNINLGINWTNSGIEYAQSYRAQSLKALQQPTKFIFLDFIRNNNIASLTRNLGFEDQDIIWLYQYFTDVNIAPSTTTVDDIISQLHITIDKDTTHSNMKALVFDQGKNFLHLYLNEFGYVDYVETYFNQKLIKRDYYSYVRTLTEYFMPGDGKMFCHMRKYYNEDGTTAYTEYIHEDRHMFVMPQHIFYSKQAFIAHFLQSLHFNHEDIILLDRSEEIEQVVFENKGTAKLGIVIHAEHFKENLTTKSHLWWNEFYEYVLSQWRNVDFYVTATKQQQALLKQHFEDYYQANPVIYCVPVGHLTEIKQSFHRKKHSMMTASRLAHEKHIDWLIKAVIKAHQYIDDLTFDIYGEGKLKTQFSSIIEQHQAQDYIKLLGHVQLDEVYKEYELFLSASMKEGFGLSLMEAVGSGLGIIGFDVNYGNPTFINHEKNGYLLQVEGLNEEAIVAQLTTAIVQFFSKPMANVHEESYTIAQQYTHSAVIEQWNQLIKEVHND